LSHRKIERAKRHAPESKKQTGPPRRECVGSSGIPLAEFITKRNTFGSTTTLKYLPGTRIDWGGRKAIGGKGSLCIWRSRRERRKLSRGGEKVPIDKSILRVVEKT